MARRSKLDTLPDSLKAWLDAQLAARGFADYDQLAQYLTAEGVPVSKSAVHRYGLKLQSRLQAVRDATAAAREIAAAAGDDGDVRSEAVMSMIQTDVFDALVQIQQMGDDELDPMERVAMHSKLAKNIATMSRARIAQAKWKQELEAKLKAAADKVEKLTRKGGMSEDTVAAIKKQILGIAT